MYTRRNYMLKGVVIPRAKMEIDKLGTMHIKSSYTAEDIAYFCLYWDKIATPTQKEIFTPFPFEKQLIQHNILERIERVNLKQLFGQQNHAENEAWAFGCIAKQKIQDTENDWLVHHLTPEPIYRKRDSLEQDLLRLKITNFLPVPVISDKNSLDDIINFKKQRADELSNLHLTLNSLLEKIHNSKVEVIEKQELSELRKAIKELDKTIIERFRVYRKSSLEIGLNINPINFSSLIQSQNFMEISTNLLSILSINQVYGVTLNLPAKRNNMQLEYISSAKSEYIIP